MINPLFAPCILCLSLFAGQQSLAGELLPRQREFVEDFLGLTKTEMEVKIKFVTRRR